MDLPPLGFVLLNPPRGLGVGAIQRDAIPSNKESEKSLSCHIVYATPSAPQFITANGRKLSPGDVY